MFYFVLAVLCGLGHGQQFIGIISLNNVGLINIFDHGGSGTSRYSVLASTYDTRINTVDQAYTLLYPGRAIASNFTGYTPTMIYNQLYWGKEISQVPSSSFGFNAVVNADGSTITGKGNGQIYLTDVRDFTFPATYDLTSPLIPSLTSYMYSRIIWKKVTTIGGDDILTCRAQYSTGSLRSAELVYFKRPQLGDELSRTWSATILRNNSCDSNLAEMQVRYGIFDQWEMLFTVGYYNQKLALFWPESGGNLGDWANPDEIQERVVDSGRQYYDVQVVDLNKDGRDDVLVSVIANDGGSVEAWEVDPNNFRNTQNYALHVLAKDFVSRNGGANGRTPGVVRAFYPTNSENTKPSVLVAGADDGRAYILTPNSQHPGDWTYNQVTFADLGTGQTVSGLAAADVDGDGFKEIFVSVHNLNSVYVYTMKP